MQQAPPHVTGNVARPAWCYGFLLLKLIKLVTTCHMKQAEFVEYD